MKKIGIITRHCYPNYGSILQTLALQSAICKVGAKPFVIDYVQEGDKPLGLVKSTLRVSRLNKSFWGRSLYRVAQTPTFVSMGLVFRRHQKRLLNLTPEVSDGAGLRRVTADLDAVVAGSDQIWNQITGDLDLNYFMNFVEDDRKKFSYAASLGSTRPIDSDIEVFLSAVKRINKVSVREPSSAEWINSSGVEARSDVDPVLLHDRNFWSEFAGSERIVKEKYVLVYQLHHTKSFEEKLKSIAGIHNCKVVRITPDWKRVFQSGSVKLLNSPEEFVSLIRDAECVVTDSFHGTAFSLRMGVPIYVIPPGKYSTRLLDVVSRVNLSRLVVPHDLKYLEKFSPEYNKNEVAAILGEQASQSWEYLRNIANGKYD